MVDDVRRCHPALCLAVSAERLGHQPALALLYAPSAPSAFGDLVIVALLGMGAVERASDGNSRLPVVLAPWANRTSYNPRCKKPRRENWDDLRKRNAVTPPFSVAPSLVQPGSNDGSILRPPATIPAAPNSVAPLDAISAALSSAKSAAILVSAPESDGRNASAKVRCLCPYGLKSPAPS